MKFKIADLKELIWDGEEKVTGRSRWANEISCVFPFEGKHYSVAYRSGTGDEGERPFEHDDEEEEIDCPEMHQVEKTVKVWERVK